MQELIIIGGGPAGVAAGVYAARKKLTTTLITESFGGQSVESAGIENWIGTPLISGIDLAKALEGHVRKYESDSFSIKSGVWVEDISKAEDGHFSVRLSSGEILDSKAVLITTGSSRRKLDIPGADTYENKGITYCASCDGPMFADKDVVVIGGGNAGFESAAQLLSYSKSVTLLHRRDSFKADQVTVDAVSKHPQMKIITNATPSKIEGGIFVEKVSYKDTVTGEEYTLDASGVFVEIGSVPSTAFAKNLVELDEIGRIKVDPKKQTTSTEGVWAAGDCTDALYQQNNIAAGDAVKALEDLYLWLRTR